MTRPRPLSRLLGGETELLRDAERPREDIDGHLGVGYDGALEGHPRRGGGGGGVVVPAVHHFGEGGAALAGADLRVGDVVHAEERLDLDEEGRLARRRGAGGRVLPADVQNHLVVVELKAVTHNYVSCSVAVRGTGNHFS